MSLENELRKVLTKSISRGILNIRLTQIKNSNEISNNLQFDQLFLEKLVKSAIDLKNKFSGENLSIDLVNFYQINGVINTQELDLNDDLLKNNIFEALNSAIANFIQSRKIEGEELKKDLINRKELLETTLSNIEPFTSNIKEYLRTKLLTKLNDSNFDIDGNDSRLQKEILFYLDKSDVTEEIIRLKSHFLQFDKFLDDKFINPGRNLDFLLQEMFREINTLGNKNNLLEVSPLVVNFKSELEKIREQVQNIE